MQHSADTKNRFLITKIIISQQMEYQNFQLTFIHHSKSILQINIYKIIRKCFRPLQLHNSNHVPQLLQNIKAQNAPILMNLHEVSVVPCHPSDKKTTTFSIKDLRKTLSQYVMPNGSTDWLYKSKHFSFTDNTHRGIAK
jgi:hypothetical protein